jgi:hypothetical protein
VQVLFFVSNVVHFKSDVSWGYVGLKSLCPCGKNSLKLGSFENWHTIQISFFYGIFNPFSETC